MFIFNYRTNAFEALGNTGIPKDRVAEFISQHPAAQNLLQCLLDQGVPPLEAMRDVLLSSLHIQETEPGETL